MDTLTRTTTQELAQATELETARLIGAINSRVAESAHLSLGARMCIQRVLEEAADELARLEFADYQIEMG